MADQLYIRQRGRGAPFACEAAVSTGGSNWISGAISLLVGGWYTKSEHDFTAFRPLNHVWQYAGAALTESLVTESGLLNIAVAPNSSLALGWSKPHGPQPDHISAYWMSGATFTVGVYAKKVLPSSGLVNGNIPGNATSVLLLDGTDRQEDITVPVVASHATGVDIPGNRAMSFDSGASTVQLRGVTGIGDGNYTVSDSEVRWTGDGPITRLTLSGVVGVTPASEDGTCRYACGGIALRITPAGGYRPLTRISLDNGLTLESIDPTAPGFDGQRYPLSLLQGHPYRRIGFDLAHGGLSAAVSDVLAADHERGGLARLHTWARLGTELELVDDAEWSSGTYATGPVIKRYFGTLMPPNNPGSTHRWGSHSFALNVHGIKRLDDDRGYFSIGGVGSVAPTTGAGGDFTIDGDWTELFVAGLGFYVFGSTANDGPYAVASSSYDSATNRTEIVVTTSVPNATADGRIEVQDW